VACRVTPPEGDQDRNDRAEHATARPSQVVEPHSLDRTPIFRERHVGHVLTEYENHYNTHRPHRALKQLPPIGDVGLDRADGHGTAQRTEILGGLINEYRHAA
jgi:hypothetical protein